MLYDYFVTTLLGSSSSNLQPYSYYTISGQHSKTSCLYLRICLGDKPSSLDQYAFETFSAIQPLFHVLSSFHFLKGLDRSVMEDDLSFDLDRPDVEAPVNYWEICQLGTFQEMRHCCQVPHRRHAHLVPVRFGCAVAYDIVPKCSSS
jgi:hypothetical protein